MNLLVFDIDGTLIDSTGVDAECYQAALYDSYKISLDGFKWEHFTDVTDQGVTEDILFDHFQRKASKEELALVEIKMGELVRKERQLNPHKFRPSEGIESLLRELLDSKNTAFCMATGAWHESAQAKLSALSINLENQPWEHAGPIRRRADIVKSAIEKAKKHYKVSEFDQVCALGDGQWDLLTAKELKIDFIGIDLHRDNRLKSLGADDVLHGYPDLIQLCNIAFEKKQSFI